ncbi:MAG: helix-turn-helix domain-containing protein [Pseudolysinimonas sp.]|jgi:predicted nucleotidyltransferase|uniref:helix-turn-helix domain-containing protein n=1 Tax=Pseudolysinimonas sp. TaxID=2680009 RepID=UPI003C74EB2B
MTDIRGMRRAAGLTQAELAVRAGTARPNIAAYESGAKTPSPEVRDRLIAAMRPRPSDALHGHEAEVLHIAARYGATRVRVFGSVANGLDTIDSDLDLLVDPGPATSLFDLFHIEDEIADLLSVGVDVVSARTASDEMLASAIDLRPSTAA